MQCVDFADGRICSQKVTTVLVHACSSRHVSSLLLACLQARSHQRSASAADIPSSAPQETSQSPGYPPIHQHLASAGIPEPSSGPSSTGRLGGALSVRNVFGKVGSIGAFLSGNAPPVGGPGSTAGGASGPNSGRVSALLFQLIAPMKVKSA